MSVLVIGSGATIVALYLLFRLSGLTLLLVALPTLVVWHLLVERVLSGVINRMVEGTGRRRQ